jgi:GT2 family glycosyltransferase
VTRVVVLGMITKMPVPGVVWQALHYVEGLRRLGCEVWYVETHGRTPSMFMQHERDDGSLRAATFLEAIFSRFGLGDRWAYRALHHDGRCFGLGERQLEDLFGSASLILNLHGGTLPLPELVASERLIYLETDPVQLQVELAENRQESLDFLAPHRAFFSFAENLGHDDCGLPVDPRFSFLPTRQPVVLDWWGGRGGAGEAFTTIGNWRQQWRDVRYGEQTYSWSKHLEWARFLDLPARTGADFELALSGFEADDRALLERHGWRLRAAMDLDLDGYRDFICGSRAEFTVAKEQNVRLRTGWFSDRSATYLAAGRPVITQDTGFGRVLPTGEGLFAVATPEQAATAVEAILADPGRHGRAAAEIAREYFSHERVLRPLLAAAGASLPRGRPAAPGSTAAALVPEELSLAVGSRRPTILPAATEGAALVAPLPAAGALAESIETSVVVVCHDGLAFTKLCLTALLENTAGVEVVVVDNGSADGTGSFLELLAGAEPRVRLMRNEQNLGFPKAANQGLSAARGEALVLLNNDTVTPPGWLQPLLAALADPSVGLAGPATNRIGTRAEVATGYGSLGELYSWSARRAAAKGEARAEIDLAAMFCLALRRQTFERVGPLDEQFGLGLLEDDDYAERVRATGLRVVCAEGSFVHHFGEASFGALVPSGERESLLRRNRERFEAKHGRPWRPYERPPGAAYAELRERIRDLVEASVPASATVLVVSRGDESLLDLAGRRAWHFPQDADGVYAGHYPGDSAEAIEQLELLRGRGGEYILFPETGLWWLDHYQGLVEHLQSAGEPVVADPGTCVIYGLAKVAA